MLETKAERKARTAARRQHLLDDIWEHFLLNYKDENPEADDDLIVISTEKAARRTEEYMVDLSKHCPQNNSLYMQVWSTFLGEVYNPEIIAMKLILFHLS